jgi:hypothetical protein
VFASPFAAIVITGGASPSERAISEWSFGSTRTATVVPGLSSCGSTVASTAWRHVAV